MSKKNFSEFAKEYSKLWIDAYNDKNDLIDQLKSLQKSDFIHTDQQREDVAAQIAQAEKHRDILALQLVAVQDFAQTYINLKKVVA